MVNFELLVLILFVTASIILVFKDFKRAFFVLLVLSVLLHKEFFSIWYWDVLPVRVLMVAATVFVGVKILEWLLKNNIQTWKLQTKKLLNDPFIILFTLLWLVRGISLVNTTETFHSILFMGFFTAVYFVITYTYLSLFTSQKTILEFLDFYVFVVFCASLFGYFQLLLYTQTGVIIGALWNVPGHLARVGSVFWDVNHFGGLLASVLPYVGVKILVSNSWKQRGKYLVYFLPMVGTLLLTNSRTAWLLAFFAFLIFISLLLFKRFHTRGILLLALGIFLISIPFGISYMNKSSPFRAAVKQYFHYRIDSFDSHFLLLEGTLQIWEKFPIIGGGYGSFFGHFKSVDVADEYFSRDPAGLNSRVPAHSIWGEAWAETGAIGFTLVLGMFLLAFTALSYASLTSKTWKDEFVYAAMAGSILGWAIAGVFYSYNSEFFWFIFVIYLSYAATSVSELKSDFYQGLLEFLYRIKNLSFITIIAISAFLIFLGLGKNHLIPWDEAIYGKVAHQILETGDPFTLRWADEADLWFEKPPLNFWFMAVFMSFLGKSELAVRLPSAIMGFGSVLVTYLFAKRAFKSNIAGIFAGLSLITNIHFLYYSRTAMLDISLTFWSVLAVYLYFLGREKSKAHFWFLSGSAIGAAVMTKSIVGLLPGLDIFVYELYLLAVDRKFPPIKKYFALLVGLLLVATPWHIYMYMLHGDIFFKEYIGYHVLSRATTAIEDKGAPWYFYFTVARVGMRLWFVGLLTIFPLIIYRLYKNDRSFWLFLIATTVIFVFFSSATSKLIWYLLPIYPFIGALLGGGIVHIYNLVSSKFKFLGSPAGRFLFVFAISFVALSYFFTVKNFVYVSDLTGNKVKALQEKEKVFGLEKRVYIDLIEVPLIYFYTDGPFTQVNFSTLESRVKETHYKDDFIFITKESRVRKLQERNPKVEFVEQFDDWGIGKIEAGYSYDKEKLEDLKTMLDRTKKEISKMLENGEDVPSGIYDEVELKENQIEELEESIAARLASPEPIIK